MGGQVESEKAEGEIRAGRLKVRAGKKQEQDMAGRLGDGTMKELPPIKR